MVSDCPGFLVNRVLTPYVLAFLDLLAEGVDFARIDQSMAAFGWPMGPAYLNDVVGLDTAAHVFRTIGSAYPQRMSPSAVSLLDALVAQGRLGQKSGFGFYHYQRGEDGRPFKTPATDICDFLDIPAAPTRELSNEEIVQRLMLPMLLEAAHCLEEGVVGSVHELDTSMTLGLGFPVYLGGPLKYIDWLGAAEIVARTEALAATGVSYALPESLKRMARENQRFY